MRSSVALVAVVFLLLIAQEAYPQTNTTSQHEPLPPSRLLACSFSDSMPNGYRKPEGKTVMPNGYRKADDKSVMPNSYRKPETDAEQVFTMVEQQPAFPGGMKALSAFLKANVRLPDEARKAGVKDCVFVSFIVERDGTLSSPEILKSLGFGCDEEALHVLALMPRWEPGKQSGAALRVKYNLPIAFGPG